MPERDLFLLFVQPLQRSGFRYLVTGSVAAVFYGEPRFTLDVDVMIHLRQSDIAKLPAVFPEADFYLPPAEIIAAETQREDGGHFNILHRSSGFKADLYPVHQDELETWAFRFQRQVEIGGEVVCIAPPEYVIVRKLEYFREGGSEKHLRDVRSMLAVSGQQLDRSALQDWIQRRGLESQWKLISD